MFPVRPAQCEHVQRSLARRVIRAFKSVNRHFFFFETNKKMNQRKTLKIRTQFVRQTWNENKLGILVTNEWNNLDK